MKTPYVLACVMVSALSGQLRAQSTLAKATSDKQPVWMQYCDMSVREFRLTRKPDPTTRQIEPPFALMDHAVFVHLDAVESDEHGLLYAWKNKDGRPNAKTKRSTVRLGAGGIGKRANETGESHSARTFGDCDNAPISV